MSAQVSYKKQITFGILLLIIILLVFEGALRIYDYYNPNCNFISSDVYSDIDNELKRWICLDNDNVKWIDFPYLHLEPNQHLTTININNDGFRGNDISLEKSPNTYRIFVVGGSTTFGVGSSSDATTIPGYLQNYFQEYTDLNVQVINAGIPKAYSYTETNYIKNILLQYEPDLFIVYDGWNDLGRSSDSYFEGGGAPSLFEKITRGLFNSGYYNTEKILWKNYSNWRATYVEHVKLINFDDIDERVNLWKNSWTELCELSIKKNVDVIITLQPLVGTGNKELTDEEIGTYKFYNQDHVLPNYEKYFIALEDLGIVCSKSKDLRNIFDDRTETIFFDKGHVGDLGNQIIAKELFELSLPILKEKTQ
jgi:lysophospholipase L1-like esterase